MPVVHGWSISGDLPDHSCTISQAFRHISLARRGISEPREGFAKREMAIPGFGDKGEGGRNSSLARLVHGTRPGRSVAGLESVREDDLREGEGDDPGAPAWVAGLNGVLSRVPEGEIVRIDVHRTVGTPVRFVSLGSAALEGLPLFSQGAEGIERHSTGVPNRRIDAQ